MGSLAAIISEAKQARSTSLPAKDIISEIYKGYIEEDSWKQKKSFAPSGLFYGSGACSRRWVLSFQGNHYESKASPLDFARMKGGTKSHERIEDAIQKSGVARAIELELHNEDPPIHAYADAVIEYDGITYVGEIKTTTHENFEYRRNTNKIADYHLGQILICMRLAKIDKGIIIYESTKTNELHGIIVEMTKEHSEYVDNVLQWCRDVWELYETETLPERSFRKGTKVCSKCPVEKACDDRPVGVGKMRKLPVI
jgi:hypothetical protein